MKYKLYKRSAILLALLFVFCAKSFAQITVSADSVTCGATGDTLRASVTCIAPTPTGIRSDDGWSGVINLGFTYNFYGSSYTQCLVGSNGAISFNTGLAGGGFGWSITSVLLGNASVRNCVCGPWCDICIPCCTGSACGPNIITYATTGSAPNRKFVATWCHTAMYSCTTQWTTTEIILYESTNIAEVHIAHKTTCSWNGGYAIVGVQNSAGSAATAAPSRDYPTVWTARNEAWRFTPNSASTAYTCSSISFAPMPLCSSTLYWFDSSTGTLLGTGPTLYYAPTGGTGTVYCMAVGCDDTSRVYYHLDLMAMGGGNSPVHITSKDTTNPSICGVCDGVVKLVGVNPYVADTIFYSYRGVLQPYIVATAGADSTLTITGLCAGHYDYFYVKEGPCPSNRIVVDLADPPFTISGTSFTNPTTCGACDGTITINGLVPGFTDTIRYDLGGVPQTPVVFTISSSGSVTLTGLVAGVYSNIRAYMSYCVTPPVGPITLTNPAFVITDTSHTNANCSACDGTFTLYGMLPSRSITLNYNYNGSPQAPISTTTNGSGAFTITGLCPGVYDNFSVTLVSCVVGACVATHAGRITVVPPPLIPIRHVSRTNPFECGACNGTIKITGMDPGTIDTIFYRLNGVPQPPVIYSAAPDSSVTLYGLCAGAYSNFFVKVGPCPTTTLTATITLVDPPINAGFTTTIRYGCTMDTVLFTNSSTSPGRLWYLWRFGDGMTDTAVNPVHLYRQGTPTVTLFATNHYCTDSFSIPLNLNHPIKAIFSGTPLVCQGANDTFTNTSIGIPPTSAWSFGDGSTSIAANPVHKFANVGTYTVRLIATNFVPCSDTAYQTVTVDSQTEMSIHLSDSVLCRGAVITLNSTYTNIGNTGMVWTFGDGDSIRDDNPTRHAYYQTGTFTVTAISRYRVCAEVSVSKTVTVIPNPGINLGADTSICEGSAALRISDRVNAGNPAARWMWNTGQTGSSIQVTTPGYYVATVTVNNCQATDTVLVSNDCELVLPNAFSPDGDGINDYFCPREFASAALSNFSMDIYNRWGQLIFQTKNLEGRGWDGRFNGVNQPEGVYVYIVSATFKDGKSETKRGNLTLFR